MELHEIQRSTSMQTRFSFEPYDKNYIADCFYVVSDWVDAQRDIQKDDDRSFCKD